MEKIIDSAIEEEIYAGVYLLERCARLLLEDKRKEAQGMLPRITELFSVILPAIVQSYEHPDMRAWRQDQQYWLNQLQRITQAITAADAFVQIDVLYCETRENLKNYLELVNGIQGKKADNQKPEKQGAREAGASEEESQEMQRTEGAASGGPEPGAGGMDSL